MEAIKFAKVFNMPNGGQVLVTKEINQEQDSESIMDLKFETRFDLDGIVFTPSISAVFKTDEACNKSFDEVDQARAETIYKALSEEANQLLEL